MNAPTWFLVLSIGLLAISIASLYGVYLDIKTGTFGPTSLLGPGFLLLIVTPLTMGVLRVNVTANMDGLHVRSGLLGFRVRRIRTESIESAECEYILPSEWGAQWGGFGWRVFLGGSAVLFEATDGLAVELVNGNRFAITVPNPELAAAVLQMAQERHEGVRGSEL